MKVKKLILGLTLAAAVLLSGCSVLDSGSLLSLPELSPEQAGLLQMVNSVTSNSDWTVTAPFNGTDFSAMQFVDFFGDGVEEAVCFFRNPAEMRLRVSVYSDTGPSGYSEFCTIETEGSGVDFADYADLDGDGALELILMVSYEHGTIYGAEVYRISNRSVGKVVLGSCAAYSVSDVTGDGREDIILARRGEGNEVVAPAAEKQDTAELFSWVDGVATKLGRVPILSGVPGSAVVKSGMLARDMPACIMDVCVPVGDREAWVSNVLIWNGEFVNLSTLALDSAMSTARYSKLLCRDADFDGYIEIPMTAAMPSPSVPAEKYTVWYGFSPEYALVQKSITYCFPGGNWYYIVPESWHGQVYVKTGSMEGLSTVAFTADRNGRPNTLLTVYRVEKSASQTLPEECFYLTGAGGYIYYALIGTPDELSPLEDEMYVRSELEVFERFVTVDSLGEALRASETMVIYE